MSGEEKGRYQKIKVTFSDREPLIDAQKKEPCQSQYDAYYDGKGYFFAQQQCARNRHKYNIKGSDKAGFSHGCLLDAELLKGASCAQTYSAAEAANQSRLQFPGRIMTMKLETLTIW